MEDERLEGDNQYDCSTCGSKQDAFRYQRITQLPPVLHFSVLRFVFDPKYMERKKSKQAINYPLSINMRPHVSEQKLDLWYDLRGVLFHRGDSAYHGHYQAHVFDVTWFLFNDEEVKEIQKEDLLGKQVNGTLRSQGSKDAYMLIYGRRDKRPADTATLTLPKQVAQAVDNLNAEHAASCDAYTQRQKNLEAEFAAIRGLKQEIYRSWHISSVDEVSAVLSREDLEKWLSGDLDKTKIKPFTRSPTIDNDPLPPLDAPSTSQQAERTATSPSPPPLDELIRMSAPSSSNDWKLKRPKMHRPGFRDPIPNADRFKPDIYCEHGGLVHSQKSREKISTMALDVLQEIFPEFEPPSTETETCSVCEAVAASDREATKEAKVKAEAERSRLYVLARQALSSLEAPRLVEGLEYALVPFSFVTQWRIWLSKPLMAPRPGPVANDQFICDHGNLTVDPTEPLDVDGVVCAISHEEWKTIHELYGGGPFIQCSIEESGTDEKDKLWTNIPLCVNCRTQRLSNLDNVSINVYHLAEGEPLPWAAEPTTPPKAKSKEPDASDVINIDDTDNDSPTLSDASPPARAPGNRKRMKPSAPITYGQRKSKRLRSAAATKKGATFSISVNKDDTVRDIKRKVLEGFCDSLKMQPRLTPYLAQIEEVEDVLPFYQQLYLKTIELMDDNQTVSQIGLLRTDRLVLRTIGAMDEDDAVAWALTSGEVEPRPARPRTEGRAFSGTLLDGSMCARPAPEAPAKVPEPSTNAPESSGSPPTGDDDHPMTSTGPTTPEVNKQARDSTPIQEPSGNSETNMDMMDDIESTATIPCSRCTFLNHVGSAYCEVCEGPLPSG
ncbi:hypothetical protein FRC06_001495 [Ceratobasidium sp. 370]|nr:hypothetical protein FRC06_001495 [Ceratobasidium sp. 370]